MKAHFLTPHVCFTQQFILALKGEYMEAGVSSHLNMNERDMTQCVCVCGGGGGQWKSSGRLGGLRIRKRWVLRNVVVLWKRSLDKRTELGFFSETGYTVMLLVMWVVARAAKEEAVP
jgi:hypothetical protein